MMHDELCASLLHIVPTPAAEYGIAIQPFQGPYQVGAMQVTGPFPGNHIISHGVDRLGSIVLGVTGWRFI